MEEIIIPSKIFLKEEGLNEATITIEPCYPGYGTTLGNALRRILLSSLPGAAVTAIRIKRVDHEFSTIEHIKEDVLEIILNLKLLRLKIFTDKPVKLELHSKGKKIIKAADIQRASDVEIVNPNLKIAEATHRDASLDMEIVVERGRGYVPAEQKDGKNLEIGMIAVDSIFTPILAVGYEVENIRVGQRTDFDRLKLKIKTDGTINPLEALVFADNILINQFNAFSDSKKLGETIEKTKKKKEIKKEEKGEIEEKVGETSLSELNFSTRTFNALDRAKIRKVSDLMSKTSKELLTLSGFGQSALKEVKKALKKLKIELKD
jgi:DNA-directed RNA polymerase subunit alpha